jgi:PST family polysaccharide transporter
MSVERTVAKNTAWLVLQPLLLNVLSVASTGYIARELGSSDFGRFNLGIAFVAMFAPLTNLSLRSLMVRHMARHGDAASRYLGVLLVLRTLLGLGAAAVALIAAPLSGGTGEARIVIEIAALGLIITTIASVYTDTFYSLERMGPASVAQAIGGIVLTITSVALVATGGGIRHMALAYTLGSACTLGLLHLWARRLPFRPCPCWDLSILGSLVREARPFVLMALLQVMSLRLDLLVLVRLLGEAHLGFYTAAMMLVDRALYLSEGAGAALLPALTRSSTRDRADAVALIQKSTLYLLIISLPVCVLVGVFAPQVVRVLFGSQYAAAAAILGVAIWRLPAKCLATLARQAMLAVGGEKIVLRTETIAMGVSLPLVFLLAFTFGPAGAAMALCIRFLLAFILLVPSLAHHFPRFWPWNGLARVVAAVALMGGVLWLLPTHSDLARSVVVGTLSMAAFGASLVGMRVVPAAMLLSRLPGRRCQMVEPLRVPETERGLEPCEQGSADNAEASLVGAAAPADLSRF